MISFWTRRPTLKAGAQSTSSDTNRGTRVVKESFVQLPHRRLQDEFVHQGRAQRRQALGAFVASEARTGHRAAEKGDLIVSETGALAVHAEISCERNNGHVG